MEQVTLSDFVAEKGQELAASLLRLSQPGIQKALKSRRNIYVTVHDDGTYEASEVRPFPSQKRSSDNEQPGAA